MSDDYFVYLIRNKFNYIYIGCTNNLIRRKRQHNRELKGGAKATLRGAGTWRYVCFIAGLSKTQALQLEWKLKRRLKKYIYKNYKKQIEQLFFTLKLKRFTKKAINSNELLLTIFWNEQIPDFFKNDLNIYSIDLNK